MRRSADRTRPAADGTAVKVLRCAHVRTTLNLAFLAPDIIDAAVAGTLPDGIGVVRLTDVDMSWAEQRIALTPRRAPLREGHSRPIAAVGEVRFEAFCWPKGILRRPRIIHLPKDVTNIPKMMN